jgi:hypothetical protein
MIERGLQFLFAWGRMLDWFEKLKRLAHVGAAAARLLVVLGAIASFAFSNVASAQSGDGVLGWGWNGAYYPTAYEACRAQWMQNMDNGYSRFIGHKGSV